MRKLIVLVIAIILLFNFAITSYANYERKVAAEGENYVNTQSFASDIDAKSAILMEAKTGKILYSKNETDKASPASVTKIMTLIVVCKALEDGRINLTDNVTVSDNASSMGGSQVFLKEGETMTVEELIKCTVIASANDAATALAEHTSGSVDSFVAEMNKTAKELNLKNSNFENPTGLDDTTTNHYSSAEDIAIMSRKLIQYDIILKYSNVWQDTIRNGEFTLTNTNS